MSHSTKKYTVITPKYVTRFQCIGPKCEDTCCAGWRVSIDKQTYEDYRTSEHPLLRAKFETAIVHNSKAASDAEYAFLQLKPNSPNCAFLAEGSCEVHRDIGPEALSDTCYVYPRQTYLIDGQCEQVLSMSCPEAARLALLADDAFDFVLHEFTVRDSTMVVAGQYNGVSLPLINEVRIFCLQLMRTKEMELWQRLAVLGLFCENLTTLVNNRQPLKIMGLIGTFRQMVEGGQILDALGEMPSNHEIQSHIFFLFIRMNWEDGWRSARLHDIQTRIQEGLGIADGLEGELTPEQRQSMMQRYSEGLARLPQALEAAPHLIENYMLNSMLIELFPFKHNSTYEDFLVLATRFGILRMTLAAQCTPGRPLPTVDQLVQTVQIFAKRYQHNRVFSGEICNILQKSGWSDLKNVYSFLRA